MDRFDCVNCFYGFHSSDFFVSVVVGTQISHGCEFPGFFGFVILKVKKKTENMSRIRCSLKRQKSRMTGNKEVIVHNRCSLVRIR